jgi:predicted flap endonuclease-1-like 5' DNA nuclease
MLFWLGLVAGLIIGWVFEWIIDWRFWRRDFLVSLERERVLRRELSDARRELSRLQAQLADVTWPAKEAIAAVVVRDPLEQINGIGPLFAQRLHEAGIFTYAQLAAATPDSVYTALQLDERQSIDPQAWIAQARALTVPSYTESLYSESPKPESSTTAVNTTSPNPSHPNHH